jgi:hypothetical protein
VLPGRCAQLVGELRQRSEPARGHTDAPSAAAKRAPQRPCPTPSAQAPGGSGDCSLLADDTARQAGIPDTTTALTMREDP